MVYGAQMLRCHPLSGKCVVQHSSADEEWVKWSLKNSQLIKRWMGRKLASFDRNGLASVGLLNQSAESHWTTLVLKNGMEGNFNFLTG